MVNILPYDEMGQATGYWLINMQFPDKKIIREFLFYALKR
jgi:hypothetical protein